MYTGTPVLAALSGNAQPHVGHVQRFPCSCTLPRHVASSPCSFLVLHFISASAGCIHKGVHLAEGHNEMGTRLSVKRHLELFIHGINLLFNICFVLGWCLFLNLHFSQFLLKVPNFR